MPHARLLLLLAPCLAFGQGTCDVPHLTIFDANVVEVHEERTLTLQPGLNTVEWRSLMPQALIRTIRVTGERVTVTRQDVTYDGPALGGENSPVLRLTLQADGTAGPRKVQVDYLAPNLTWKADFSLVLSKSASPGQPPTEMNLDGWVSVTNNTDTDICGSTVDLVAGDIQLLKDGDTPRQRNRQTMAQQIGMNAIYPTREAADTEGTGPEAKGVSVFSRFRLGHNISMNANALIHRFPLFQKLKLPVEQRYVFENEHGNQTLARGGFMLLPEGLEVRLVSRNGANAPLPMGVVTIYSLDGDVPQIVGQDRILITPPGAEFTVTQGRSNDLQGTRRIQERHEVPDPTARNPRREKLVTKVEVVILNRAATPATAFVREGIEPWGNSDWTVIQTSHPNRKLGDRMLEFKLDVPAKGSVKVEYTVETR